MRVAERELGDRSCHPGFLLGIECCGAMVSENPRGERQHHRTGQKKRGDSVHAASRVVGFSHRSTWRATHALSVLELRYEPFSADLPWFLPVTLFARFWADLKVLGGPEGPPLRVLTRRNAMQVPHMISRRRWFEMVGAAGALAFASPLRTAWAQSTKRIERLAPELDAIIDTSQTIRELATGFGGDIGPAEGPVWVAEGHYLLFNDIQTSRRMKYTPGQGVVVAKTPTNEANGLTRDLQGRLISAEHLTRRVTREDPDGSITVVSNNFQGKRLLRPNDVIVKSDGR